MVVGGKKGTSDLDGKWKVDASNHLGADSHVAGPSLTKSPRCDRLPLTATMAKKSNDKSGGNASKGSKGKADDSEEKSGKVRFSVENVG